jgi:hypothetical protein
MKTGNFIQLNYFLILITIIKSYSVTHSKNPSDLESPFSIPLLKGPIIVQESRLDHTFNTNKSQKEIEQNLETELTPEDENTLRQIILTNQKVHIKGSFQELSNNTNVTISLTHFNEIHCCTNDTVYVGAGVTYRELTQELIKHNFALEGVPRDKDVNVVSSVINGEHSARTGKGLIARDVVEIIMLTSDGRKRVYTERDPEFKSVLVNFGYGGVVIGVTLKVVPEFETLKCIYDGIWHYDFTRKFKAMFNDKDYAWFFWDIHNMKWTLHQIRKIGKNNNIKGKNIPFTLLHKNCSV